MIWDSGSHQKEPMVSIQQTLDRILADRVILCVRLSQQAGVVDRCLAAASSGLPILEITMTTPGALEIISELSTREELLVGAGTVLTTAEVGDVARAGGVFAMSPVFDPEVVAAAHANGLLAVPGAATPTEILAAHRAGAKLVKVFPSGALGGPEYLKAIRGPLPHIPLCPTSGPSAETIADYFEAGAAVAGVGREVFPPGHDLSHVARASEKLRRAAGPARESTASGA